MSDHTGRLPDLRFSGIAGLSATEPIWLWLNGCITQVRCSATGINNVKNGSYKELSFMNFPHKEVSVQINMENYKQKRRALYMRPLKNIKSLRNRDPSTLTTQQR